VPAPDPDHAFGHRHALDHTTAGVRTEFGQVVSGCCNGEPWKERAEKKRDEWIEKDVHLAVV